MTQTCAEMMARVDTPLGEIIGTIEATKREIDHLQNTIESLRLKKQDHFALLDKKLKNEGKLDNGSISILCNDRVYIYDPSTATLSEDGKILRVTQIDKQMSCENDE